MFEAVERGAVDILDPIQRVQQPGIGGEPSSSRIGFVQILIRSFEILDFLIAECPIRVEQSSPERLADPEFISSLEWLIRGGEADEEP